MVLTINRNKSISSTTSTNSTRTITDSKLDDTKSPKKHNLKSIKFNKSTNENDKYVKLILKNFKKLEIGLNKFNFKNHGIYSTNILRTLLLPILRTNYLNKVIDNIKIYKSLVNIYLSIIIRWWDSLIKYLKNLQLSSLDRSVYLESISRIIGRVEWYLEDIDPQLKYQYNELLVITLDYTIFKLSIIKHLPLSISAFIGKVFAFSFFKIPNVSNALLFLLNIKQQVFDDTNKIFTHENCQMELLRDKLPSHLHYLINYKGLKIKRRQRNLINCLLPPTHPVNGIKDPQGVWVNKWLNSDSDIFNSFVRHYFEIIHNIFTDSVLENPFFLPGFNIILSHVFQIFKLSISRISNSRMNNCKLNQPFVDDHNQIYYNSIFKIFRTFRDIKYNNLLFNSEIIHYLDLILINFAEKISIYDFNKNCLILNILYEFINNFEEINWEFWLNSIYLMIDKTDHIQILIKNLSFLFNIWSFIPEIYQGQTHWLNDCKLSFKENFINWLISPKIWQKLFLNYNSFIRTYYLRLIIWRIIGINNFENSSSILICSKIENNLYNCYKVFENFYHSSLNNNISFKPDNPLINKKFIISKILNNDIINIEEEDLEEVQSSYSSNIKKTHPFEIFDEAIYSCTSLSDVKLDDNPKKNLLSSIGKILKIFDDDTKPDFKPPKSLSFTSLSTLSMTSRSSSPSLLSFSSTPTSLTDLSETSDTSLDSSIDDDFDEGGILFNLPPDIIRPIYKFELINDYESIKSKYYLMNNNRQLSNDYYKSLPNFPKIPTISIFFNSDIYNKIYISTDNFFTRNSQDTDKIEPNECLLENLKLVDLVNLGKSIFEWNNLVEEFETFLINKTSNDVNDLTNETDYFRKLIPLLSIDNSKALNAE